MGFGGAALGENTDGPGRGAGGMNPIRQFFAAGSVGRGVGDVFITSAIVRARARDCCRCAAGREGAKTNLDKSNMDMNRKHTF